MGTDVGPVCVRGDRCGADVCAWGPAWGWCVCMGTTCVHGGGVGPACVRGDWCGAGVCAWGVAWGRRVCVGPVCVRGDRCGAVGCFPLGCRTGEVDTVSSCKMTMTQCPVHGACADSHNAPPVAGCPDRLWLGCRVRSPLAATVPRSHCTQQGRHPLNPTSRCHCGESQQPWTECPATGTGAPP